MSPLGLLPLFQALAPGNAALKLAIAIPGIVLLILLYSLAKPSEEHKVAAPLPLSGLSTIWPFFRNRFDFLRSGFQLTGQHVFQFQLLQVSRTTYHCDFSMDPRLILAQTEHRHRSVGGTRQKGVFHLQKP
jgi:hypothetical protein